MIKKNENLLSKIARELSIPASCDMPEKERSVLLSRLAGQMGVSSAEHLPYASELTKSSQK